MITPKLTAQTFFRVTFLVSPCTGLEFKNHRDLKHERKVELTLLLTQKNKTKKLNLNYAFRLKLQFANQAQGYHQALDKISAGDIAIFR